LFLAIQPRGGLRQRETAAQQLGLLWRSTPAGSAGFFTA
jgi:hypothetical protein